jgi:hypothetical protein
LPILDSLNELDGLNLDVNQQKAAGASNLDLYVALNININQQEAATPAVPTLIIL